MKTTSKMMDSFVVPTTLKLACIGPLATKILYKKKMMGENKTTNNK